jgi:hypothetical protein
MAKTKRYEILSRTLISQALDIMLTVTSNSVSVSIPIVTSIARTCVPCQTYELSILAGCRRSARIVSQRCRVSATRSRNGPSQLNSPFSPWFYPLISRRVDHAGPSTEASSINCDVAHTAGNLWCGIALKVMAVGYFILAVTSTSNRAVAN